MSERYTFTGDRPLINDNSNNNNNNSSGEWNSFNTTLTTSMNDGYVTVNDDQTQYLSALDDTTTNEINLDNLNFTLTPNPKMEIGCNNNNNNNNDFLQQQQQHDDGDDDDDDDTITSLEQEQNNEIGENQVVVYTVEGSDELYGIQLVQDEDGNIQKYQFQFRKTEDGQLEAIPETIQILPLDDDEISVENNDNNLIGLNDDIVQQQQQQPSKEEEQQQQEQRSLQIFVQNDNADEHILPDLPTDDYNQMLFTENHTEKEQEDIKPVTIEQVNIKEEVNDFIKYNDDNFDINTTSTTTTNDERILDETCQISVEHQSQQQEQQQQHDQGEEMQQQQEEQEFSVGLESETIYADVLQSQDNLSSLQIDKNKNNNDDNTHNFNNTDNNTVIKQIILPDIDNNNDVVNVRNEQQQQQQQNESDNDEFQVVEGLHITGDLEQCLQQQQQQQKYQEKLNTISKTNILKHNVKNPERLEIKKDNRYFLYFIHHEKENVDSDGHYNNTDIYQKNPRSILKQCYLSSSPQKNEQFSTTLTTSILSPQIVTTTTTATTTMVATTTTTPTTTTTIVEHDERLSKRFARNKEAIQAMNLINFINTTTIPIAPIRKDRLPRKQKIKPVERQDEQIVVQEVMISSNSFIESTEQIDLIKRDTIEITDYVELTDTDDTNTTDSDSDYNPNNHNKNNHNNHNNSNKKSRLKKKKKSKRYKLRNQITISDTDTDNDTDEDHGDVDDKNNIIELDDDDDDDDDGGDGDKDAIVTKKRELDSNDIDQDKHSESPLKKLCLDTNVVDDNDNDNDDNDDEKKTEIPCPKCSKSFPSQNSLKTHLQHHNLENTMNNNDKGIKNNKTKTTSIQQQQQKCEKCDGIFKNRLLLAQHKCPTIFTCTICKKKFINVLDLSKHKRSHMKQQLYKTTSTIKISPNKFRSSSSSLTSSSSTINSKQLFKSPLKKGYICKQCGKVCSSLSLLNLHIRTHKEYSCNSCKLNFPSKILLENHVQKDCVKLSKIKTTNRHLLPSNSSSSSSNNLKQSTTTCSIAATTSTTTTPSRKKTHGLILICDECSLKFTNSKLLIKHKIEEHNLQTPNKSLLLSSIEKEQKKKHLYQPKPTHCGIPAKQSLRDIFADIKIQLNQETKDEN